MLRERVSPAVIRARAPLRLGLAGGGTDVSPYCDEYGGFVLNATIDKYAYAVIETPADGAVQFIAADQQQSWQGDAAARLPVEGELALHRGVYNRVVREFNGGRPIPLRMTTFSDAPPGSGLGSSSTLVVAMLKAYTELLGLPLGEYETAHLAYEIERLDLGLSGGKQDQYAATFGGFNFMEFYGGDRVIVNPLRIKNWIVSELEASTLLYFTGVSRASADIIDEQRMHMKRHDHDALDGLHRVKREAVQMKEALLRGDFELLARSLRDGWAAKKRTARSVSNSQIDEVFEQALAAGALGGKVSGAGGGGFMFLLTRPHRRMEVMRALASCGGQVMNCHFTEHGTQGWRAV
jgi:D-glycero-alpha-D-manno-heptose-7-phosphate kinase